MGSLLSIHYYERKSIVNNRAFKFLYFLPNVLHLFQDFTLRLPVMSPWAITVSQTLLIFDELDSFGVFLIF